VRAVLLRQWTHAKASLIKVATLMGVLVLFCSNAVAKDIYSCVDAKGVQRKSDRPIPECSDREQRVLGPGGTVKRVLPPTGAASAASQPSAKKASGT
jgi:hypothetical protein